MKTPWSPVAVLGLLLLVTVAPRTSSAAAGPQRSRLLVPDISVIGMPKSGTSHLYRLIKSHSDVKISLRKEWCPSSLHPEDVASWAGKVDGILRQHEAKRGVTFSSCIVPNLSWKYYQYARSQDPGIRPKFIYVMRDPAEWKWEAWNFWTNGLDKVRNPPTNWVQAGKNYRSPELFHELLLGGGMVEHTGPLTSEAMKVQYFWRELDLFIDTAGRDNVLVVNSDDLEPDNVHAVLPRLAKFMGLSVEGFDWAVLSGKTNTGYRTAVRGVDAEASGEAPPGVYEISAFRPMLDKSRRFIYSRLHEFCLEALQKYQVRLHKCLEQLY